MSAPFMQLYVADYLGDTRHLTTEQHGAYLLLLMTMWRSDGVLSDDPAKLARIAGLTVARWKKISDDIMAFFTPCEGGITQGRLVAELTIADEKSEKRSQAGKAGGRAKALKDKKAGVANAKRSSWHSPEPEPDKESGEAIASLVQNLGVAIEAAVASMKREAKRAFDQRFAAFWAAYPRRVKKPDALKAYTKAEAKIGDDALAVILAGIERALPGWDNPQFIPHPATWLNACQWEDETLATIIPLRIGNDRPSPDRKYDAKQQNYAAALTGSEWADQVLAARRDF